MGRRRKQGRLSAAHWRELISDWEDSGLTQKRFCERHGVALSTFVRWKSRLAEESSARELAPRAELIELMTPNRDPRDTVAVELDLGSGLVLRIHRS
jgi:hypothetical protein